VLELPPAETLKPKTKVDELFAAHDPTKPKKKASRAGKKRRRTTASDDDDGESERPATPIVNDTDAQAEQLNIQNLNLTATIDKASHTSPSGLQIMDLESDEPMIMYEGQIYSCQWASSVGSDLLFTKHPENPAPDYKPLHSFREVDILAIGAAKLVACPATIERRVDFTQQSDLDAPIADANVTIQNEEVIRQARFLGRIAEIKARRGEQVGNLKTLADSVHKHPENFGPGGSPVKRGRGGRGRSNRRATMTSTPTITSARSRRSSAQDKSSAPTPTSWPERENDEGE
jgi:hypothetical protein